MIAALLSRAADLTGQRMPPNGRLTVISLAGHITVGHRRVLAWNCLCDCGTRKVIRASLLASGRILSCGCVREAALEAGVHTTHGATGTPEYRIWAGMIGRCTYPSHTGWKDYGGRGIQVCQRWRESFLAFLADVGPLPGPGFSIDRFPNNNGNYEPGNVRWATRKQQAANKRPRAKKGANHAK